MGKNISPKDCKVFRAGRRENIGYDGHTQERTLYHHEQTGSLFVMFKEYDSSGDIVRQEWKKMPTTYKQFITRQQKKAT